MYQILPSSKGEVMEIMPVQKQTRAGVGLGDKYSKEVALTIKNMIITLKCYFFRN